MKKIFIYYSLTGNGEVIAEHLKINEYDIRKIETSKKLPENYILRILVGGYKTMINYEDKLINFNNKIEQYDEIIIGSPIWNSRLSSPINTVLKLLDFKDKKVSFILYSGSGKSQKATEIINKKYPNAKIIDLHEPKKFKKQNRKNIKRV